MEEEARTKINAFLQKDANNTKAKKALRSQGTDNCLVRATTYPSPSKQGTGSISFPSLGLRFELTNKHTPSYFYFLQLTNKSPDGVNHCWRSRSGWQLSRRLGRAGQRGAGAQGDPAHRREGPGAAAAGEGERRQGPGCERGRRAAVSAAGRPLEL